MLGGYVYKKRTSVKKSNKSFYTKAGSRKKQRRNRNRRSKRRRSNQ